MRQALLSLTLFFSACGAEIGDECQSSVDCSPEGDRICDLAQSGGYCTVKNCGPDACPDDALCVQFGTEPRFERRYCMAKCESDGECRSGGYQCVEPGDNDSVVIDENRSGRYCVDMTPE